jgi:uncharacterized protein YyaL (SSP411 family)
MKSDTYKNHLAGEPSLYLQQHANNPVDWYPWSDEAWDKAKKENKLVLVSIGYSSCHWCHVMEHETFMDEKTAKIMNEFFVCIKVDREERPDIDQVYMSAVQLMTGSGGWPLNCFTLPDGKPLYGGTYFPRNNWDEVLIKLKDFYSQNPDKAIAYAEELASGINQPEIISTEKTFGDFSPDTLNLSVATWKKYLDNTEGGPARAPKFPLPDNYRFLLRYASTNSDSYLLDHINLTLKKMAYGGIYDQLAGGFCRYSTDSMWKVPHFEKMLYDNAQLISLYSSAYKLTQNPEYKQIAEETILFLKKDMSDGNGSYYSAIDADSEGEEGKYYVWTKEEISTLKLPVCGKANSLELLKEFYNINDTGYWEKNNYILLRKKNNEEIAEKFQVSLIELEQFISEAKNILLKKREERIRPVTDKKVVTSWNALQITALCEAYEAFGNVNYKDEAIVCANRLLRESTNSEGVIVHTVSKKSTNAIGYLEDYSFTISALIRLYEITFDESWLDKAKTFSKYAISNYYDKSDGLFWFTSKNGSKLIARKKEISDNVIPSSNSEMAHALYKLSVLYDDERLNEISTRMLSATVENLTRYPSSYSNWMNLYMSKIHPTDEVVFMGEKSELERKQVSSHYLPNAIFCGSVKANSNLPLLENRFVAGKTLIYLCRNRTCRLPVESSSDAILLLKAR